MAGASLEVQDLSYRYRNVQALRGLSFSIPPGAVAAFVGANGAGKTTAFSLIAGFLQRPAGEIQINGQPVEQYRARGGILGLLPQDMQFFEYRSLRYQLRLFGRLAGLSRSAACDEAERVLQLTRLSEKGDARFDALSHGMKVRAAVAQALIGDPPLVLLDEPTAGLDPVMVATFRELVAQLRGRTTLVISSHDLSELQGMCDYLCIIDRGQLVRQGPMQEALRSSGRVVLRGPDLARHAEALQRQHPELQVRVSSANELAVHYDADAHRVGQVNRVLLTSLFAIGAEVEELMSRKSLEEAYLQETSQRPGS